MKEVYNIIVFSIVDGLMIWLQMVVVKIGKCVWLKNSQNFFIKKRGRGCFRG